MATTLEPRHLLHTIIAFTDEPLIACVLLGQLPPIPDYCYPRCLTVDAFGILVWRRVGKIAWNDKKASFGELGLAEGEPR